jgi:hypothetical protein
MATLPMHRRSFLRLAALGAGATLAGAAGCGPGADADRPETLGALARPELLDVLGPEQVRALGARYRELVPEERELPALRAALDAERPLVDRLLGRPAPAPAERVRRDFAEGRTVELEGWVLSRTEARQCALFSLAST